MKNLDIIGYSNYCVTPDGKVYSVQSERYLSLSDNYGYKRATLRNEDGAKTFRVHRLVAFAFLGIPVDPDMVVNHIDGDRSNNHVTNLEWCTQSGNVKHAHATGLVKDARRHSQRSLTDELVHKICRLIQDGSRNKDIVDMLNVDKGRVAEIRNGSCYPDISCEYDFTKVPSSRRKLSTEKLTLVCEMLQDKRTYVEIKQATGCSSSTISRIRKRETGTHISNNFSW
tara:strand:+ start:199 stop:879 length:681 start_codon:yes stop_codon:yes gene_type:complete